MSHTEKVTADCLLGARRSDTARQRLVEQTTALIARQGLDGFDIDGLVRRAHCSRTTVYRHIGGKSAIIEAVLETSSTNVVGTVRAATAGLSGEHRARTATAVGLRELRDDRVVAQFLRSHRLIDATPMVLESPPSEHSHPN